MLSFRKLDGLGSVALHVCDISVYLRMADSKNSNIYKVSSSCLSHLLQPDKHHVGLHPRGHSYALPTCPGNLYKCCFIPRCLFCFLSPMFNLYCTICAFVTCLLINRVHIYISSSALKHNLFQAAYRTS